MIKKFSFTRDQLNIVPEDLHALLGFEEDKVPDPFPGIIESALNNIPELNAIEGGYRIFDKVKVNNSSETIQVEDQVFKPSKVVTTQLKNSSHAALFICTAGKEISELSNQVASNGDPMLAYVYDVIGSVMVEKAMDKIQNELEKQVADKDMHISDRYSPGYCEWSVSEQKFLFKLMPDKFCGVSLSESCLMYPIKSVSGIIGIGESLQRKGYQCQWCTDQNCIYGKIRQQKKGL